MKNLTLKIQINKPLEEVFEFTINPKNTPKWLDSVVIEEANEWPIKQGTVYRNQNTQGEWGEYTVTRFKKNEMFEWTKSDNNYHVRYTFKPIGKSTTELEYSEWVEKGELDDPFTMEILQKIKLILDNK